jgi:hypothetical protein
VGTEGVRAAAERLAGALVLTPEEKRSHNVVQRAIAAAGLAWRLFAAGKQVHGAIEGWSGVLGFLPPSDPPSA